MTVQDWSERITLVHLGAEPSLSDDLSQIVERVESGSAPDLLISFADVRHLNSSNISQLLRIRQKLILINRRLALCSIPDTVWSVMLMTGLDKIFHFEPDVAQGLAYLQLRP
jgi:anti-anti-sigma factor